MSDDLRFMSNDLRSKAQAMLERAPEAVPPLDQAIQHNAEAMLEELRIHQAELEVQNDELRRTRLEAQEAHHYYLSLFDALPILALVLDAHGLIVEANQQTYELFGFRSAAMLRKHSIYRLMLTSSGTALAETLRQPVERAHPLPDLSVRSASGEMLVMEAHIARLPSLAAPERRFLLLMIDRTQERDLARQTQLYETIINHANSIIYAFDADQRCILANDSMLQLMGKPRQEVLGQLRADLVPAEDSAQYDHNDARVWSTGQPVIYEEKLHLPGEPRRYFLSHKFPLRDGRGHMFAVGGITTDITETREVSLRLELAMQVFSQGSEGVVVTDHHNRITSVNRAFVQITGYTEAEALGQNPRLIASGRHTRAFYDEMWKQINAAGKWEGEIWNRRKSGEVYPQWLTISRVDDASANDRHYVGVFADITQRKMAEEEIERLAFYDSLTGLPNRYLLKDRARQQLLHAERSGTAFALAFIDLDHFKEVNDVHGHDAGDEVLREAVRRMREYIRETDTLARLAGDEFIWLVADIPPEEMANRLTALLYRVAEPYSINGQWVHVSASIGLAMYPEDGTDYDTLLKHADMAMYEAKAAGRNTFRFFNVRMAESLREKYQLENLLRNAVERNELQVLYQPQFDLNSRQVVGLEALLRWHSPVLGTVPPDRFIPVAEQTALINHIGGWVLEQVCQQIALWQQQGLDGFTVALNVSAKQFWGDDFIQRVKLALQHNEVRADRLEIELTERLAMGDAKRSIEKMKALKALGVRLSIDDFGTGYSSLAYLRWMPVDVLKIDKSFVQDIGTDPDDEVICRTIIQLGKGLGMTVLAEGVETEAQARFLTVESCDLAQGYLVARPMPVSDLSQLLERAQA